MTADTGSARRLVLPSSFCPYYIILTDVIIIIIIIIIITADLSELRRRLSSVSNDSNETLYLFQRISVALQRFNSVLLHDFFPDNTPDQ